MCIFCMIAKKEIPSYKIYEDEDNYAFLDIAKDVPGHTVVISKKHVENLNNTDEETYLSLMKVVKKIADHYVKDLGYDATNVFTNSGEAAGQSVMHMHYHIVPRKKEDGVTMGLKGEVVEELEETAKKLAM